MSQMYTLNIDGNPPERQASTTSTTPMLNGHDTELETPDKSPSDLDSQSASKVETGDNESQDALLTTAIPIREEFRCRRSWFFYHDIRALVTSWIPLPVFLVWRLFVFLYIFIWLIIHIVARNDDFGPRWLIYFTDLSYLLLVIGTAAICFLCVGYTIVHYTSPDKLIPYFPRMKTPIQRVYRQDNIPWFVKVCWFLYILGASLAPLVTAGYWILVYRPVCESAEMPTASNASLTSTNMTGFNVSGPPDQGANIICVADIDVYTLHLHCINAIIVLFDLFLSRIPFQFMHFFYPLVFQLPYVIFTTIYWGAGGTNPVTEERFIYSALDYTKATAVVWAIALVLAPIPFYWILFLLAWLRDVISKQVSCCYRDIQYRGFEMDNESSQEPETTKL